MPGMHEYLQQMVERSSKVLLASNGNKQDGLLFLGNPQLVFPRMLFEDPVLEPVDRNVWAIIKLLAAEGDSVTAFPTYEELMLRCNIGSKATIARSISILRTTRWLAVCRVRLRDSLGRVRGNVYALHDEPLQLAETMELDSQYLEWLEKTAQGKHSPHRRAVALAGSVLRDMRKQLQSGVDISQLEPPLERRHAATQALQAIRRGDAVAAGVSYFGRSVQSCTEIASRSYLKSKVQKLYPDEKADKPTHSTETVLSGNWQPEYRICTKPGTDSVLRSSKYVNKNTTTSVITTEVGGSTETVLAWPTPVQQLDANNRALVRMQLATIPNQQHSMVLEALAAKLSAIAEGKAKSLTYGILPYTRKLCELACKGELNPVSAYPTFQQAQGSQPAGLSVILPSLSGADQLRVLQGKVSDYAGEVRHLEGLSRIAGVELSGLAEAREKWKEASLGYQTLLQQQASGVEVAF